MLRHIGFAGIDKKTDISELVKLQQEFPLVEFGVLSSIDWAKNGNRYPDPVLLKTLKGTGLNLCLHLCGELARRPLKEGWNQVEEFFGSDLGLFQRVQLNVIGSTLKKEYALLHLDAVKETIIQQKSVLDMPIYESYILGSYEEPIHTTTSVLFDLSGGRGKYVKDFDVLELSKNVKHGFAGGLSPDNCVEALQRIEDNLSSDVDYWIDMESGVRDDRDWFSVEKCRQVCERVYAHLRMTEVSV